MWKLLATGALLVAAANAQTISVGVLGGVPFTDVVSATSSNGSSTLSGTQLMSFSSANGGSILPTSSNFVVGPALQVNLPLNLRFEVDALYRPYSFSITNVATGSASRQNVSAADWQFPFLAQYRFSLPVVKPFIEGGLSFNHLSNISAAANNITAGAGQLVGRSHAAVVLGGGVDLKLPLIRLSGELRYTHQGSADFAQISNLNQAEVLFGLHF